MKRKYKLISNELGNIEKEVEVREPSHFEAQLRYPAKTILPKKGKGSRYSRTSHPSTQEVLNALTELEESQLLDLELEDDEEIVDKVDDDDSKQ